MAERLTINLITYSTVLGLFTSSLYKSMRESLTLSLSAESTSLGCPTGSLCPNVLTNLFIGKLGIVSADDAINDITRSECKQKDH